VSYNKYIFDFSEAFKQLVAYPTIQLNYTQDLGSKLVYFS